MIENQEFESYHHSLRFTRWDHVQKRISNLLHTSENIYLPLLLFKKNQIILDIGCGTGAASIPFLQRDCTAVGIDIDIQYFQSAKNFLGKKLSKFHFILANCIYLPFREEVFDALLSIGMFEHIHEGFLRKKHSEVNINFASEIIRVLNLYGILLITTANGLFYKEPHTNILFLSFLPYECAEQYAKRKNALSLYDRLPKNPTFFGLRRLFKRTNQKFEINLNGPSILHPQAIRHRQSYTRLSDLEINILKIINRLNLIKPLFTLYMTLPFICPLLLLIGKKVPKTK